jgi:2-polyprenyl-3-methyl-5-hydroxy-6-metoxy-1,4-benzoquinol methylase
VLEHVPHWRDLVVEAARLLRPGGLFYVNTISRTWRGRVLSIWLGEGLGFVPRGTHDHRLFVRPDELAAEAGRHGMTCERTLGQRVRVLKTALSWRLAFAPSRATWGMYSAWLTKTG